MRFSPMVFGMPGYLLLGLFLLTACTNQKGQELPIMRQGFQSPPPEARPRALWDWVDGNFQLEEITREMEEAARMGMGGFDIWDVRSVVDEDSIMPAGPAFMSQPSVEAICHAIREAERIGLDLGLIISSGWNAGGSWTLPEHQTMGLYRSEVLVEGPGEQTIRLPFPDLPDRAGKPGREKEAFIPRGEDGLPVYYSEVAVIAYPELPQGAALPAGDLIELAGKPDRAGTVTWGVPEGTWKIVRYVCTNSGQPMISSTPNSHGPMIDHFSGEAMERHLAYFIDRIEAELGKPVGESGLDYLYTDSYEIRGQLWTPRMAEEFERRTGYSLIPYLPALEGRTVGDGEITRRFLYDYRKVLSDLIIENHYELGREICEGHGIGFVAEAAGPGWPVHNCPFESLKSSGALSFPRGEFWHMPGNNEFWRQRKEERGDHYLQDLQVIKGVASASHIYDRKYVEAEAFTGTHLWNEGPGDLKPTADRAFCEGLNRINFHTWPHTPEEAGTPGWVYAFGTLINEHRIWWPMAKPWIDYLGRCSYLLQQGNFVGDVLFYYGDSAPNFVPAKHRVPGLGFGYDYDVINSDVLLNRLEVSNGKLVLPHGQSYRLLVLPEEDYMQPEILEKVGRLVEAGALVSGPRPTRSHGLYQRERRDEQVRELAGEIWGECDGERITRTRYGKGRVFWGEELRDILLETGVIPDFGFEGTVPDTALDFIHRQAGDTDIYFIRNATGRPVSGMASFRQQDKEAEYWDPATGKMYSGYELKRGEGITQLPLALDAYGSAFVVFAPHMDSNMPGQVSEEPLFGAYLEDRLLTVQVLEGPWEVTFPDYQAGPGMVLFDSLVYWNDRPEEEIRFFSGIASYEMAFPLSGTPLERVFLEFGDIVETARVTLNDREVGIIWKRPYRVEITGALEPGTNRLKVEIANTWANGLAGDARLPREMRRTRTNVTRLPNAWTYPLEEIPNEEYGLLKGGITGPVKLTTFQTP